MGNSEIRPNKTSSNSITFSSNMRLWIPVLVIIAGIIISYVTTSANVKYNEREIIKIEERSLNNNNKIVINEKHMIEINGRLDAIDKCLSRIERKIEEKN